MYLGRTVEEVESFNEGVKPAVLVRKVAYDKGMYELKKHVTVEYGVDSLLLLKDKEAKDTYLSRLEEEPKWKVLGEALGYPTLAVDYFGELLKETSKENKKIRVQVYVQGFNYVCSPNDLKEVLKEMFEKYPKLLEVDRPILVRVYDEKYLLEEEEYLGKRVIYTMDRVTEETN